MLDPIATGMEDVVMHQRKDQWQPPSIKVVADLSLTDGGKGNTRPAGEVGLTENPSLLLFLPWFKGAADSWMASLKWSGSQDI